MIFALDIETEGLDPRVHAVRSAAIVSATDAMVCSSTHERTVLEWVDEQIRPWPGPGDRVVTWNGGGFDWPFLDHRFGAVGMARLPLGRHPQRRPKYEPLPTFDGVATFDTANPRHVDVAYAYRQWCEDQQCSWSLKAVAERLGVEPLVAGDGETSLDMGHATLAAYNLSDARLTYALASLLTPEDLDAAAD